MVRRVTSLTDRRSQRAAGGHGNGAAAGWAARPRRSRRRRASRARRRRPASRPPRRRGWRRAGRPSSRSYGPVGRPGEHGAGRRRPHLRARQVDASTLRRSTAAARRSLSTNSTCAAPRDSASSPSAPEPAHRSSTRAPSSPGSCASAREQRLPHPVGRRPGARAAARASRAPGPPLPPATSRAHPRSRTTSPARAQSACARATEAVCERVVTRRGRAGGRRPRPAAPCRWPAASTVPAPLRGDARLHLHRLDGRHRLARPPPCRPRPPAASPRPRTGRRCGRGLARSAFSAALTSVATVRVAHRHRAQLPVQRREHRAVAALVGLGDRLQLDEQRDAGLQLDGVLDARGSSP